MLFVRNRKLREKVLLVYLTTSKEALRRADVFPSFGFAALGLSSLSWGHPTLGHKRFYFYLSVIADI